MMFRNHLVCGTIRLVLVVTLAICHASSWAADKAAAPARTESEKLGVPGVKFLFLDYRQFEVVDGFTRQLEPPRKHGKPLFVSDQPWEGNWLQLYGSVIRRRDGLWQMWYGCSTQVTGGHRLAYAESDDGIDWRRPKLDVVKWEGLPTNIVKEDGAYGAAILYDGQDPRPRWKYKMLCGAEPSRCICAFHSADGIHWLPAAPNPVIGTPPDCPIGLMRDAEGRYVAYHRADNGDRRVARTESWNFRDWGETKLVVEPDQNDLTNVQFYGMGSIPYGPYELGTLWVYRTEPEDMVWQKMQATIEIELTHSRGGYAWHRTTQGTPWIPLGSEGEFDSAQIKAASQPVLLENEIRYYYTGCPNRHGREDWPPPSKQPGQWGVSFASCKPDRFVSVACEDEGRILTRPFWVETAGFFANADIAPEDGLRAEITDVKGNPIAGFTLDESVPVRGDSCRHALAWKGNPDFSVLEDREIRVRIEARHARLYSIFVGTEEQAKRYWQFRIPYHIPMRHEKSRL